MVVHEVEEVIRQPFYPEEEVPDPVDSICLHRFWKRKRHWRKRHWRLNCGGDEKFHVHDFLQRRLGFNLSKPVKFAIILATTAHEFLSETIELNEKQTARCLALFYRYTREAIGREMYIDLVIGCYYIVVYSAIVCRPLEEITFHATGFLLSLRNLINSQTLSSDEIFLTQAMWSEIVSCLISRSTTWKTMVRSSQAILPVLRSAATLFPNRTTCPLEVDYCTQHQLPRTIRLNELHFYFRYYCGHKACLDSSWTAGIWGEIEARLTEVSSLMLLCTQARKLENCIRRIQPSQILHGFAIQHVELFVYWDAYDLFTYSQLLLESILLFKQWSKETRDAALDAAWFICQYRALAKVSARFSYQPESRALFMAGLVLNGVEFAEGFLSSSCWTNCSTRLDQEAIGGNWHSCVHVARGASFGPFGQGMCSTVVTQIFRSGSGWLFDCGLSSLDDIYVVARTLQFAGSGHIF
jgi:hypothetical protein